MSLVNYEYIQTLTEDAVDERTTLIDLLALHDDTVDSVITINQGSVTVVDQAKLNTVVTWLRDNAVIGTDFDITTLMSSTPTANLRALELIQCCVSVSWTSNGTFSFDGFIVPGRVMSVPINASVRSGGFDYSGFANATYADQAYGYVHPLTLSSWEYSLGIAQSTDQVRIQGPGLILWYQEVDGTYSSSMIENSSGYTTWDHATGQGYTIAITGTITVSTDRKARGIGIDMSVNGSKKSFSFTDPYPSKMLIGVQLSTTARNHGGELVPAQVVEGGLITTSGYVARTYLTDLYVQFHEPNYGWISQTRNIGDYQEYAGGTKTNGNNYRWQTSSNQTSYPYIGGSEVESYTVQQDGVTCVFTGNGCLTSPLVTAEVSGTMTGSVGDVVMSLVPGTITSTAGHLTYLSSLTVPSEGTNAYLVPVVPRVARNGDVTLQITNVQGIPSGTTAVLASPQQTDLVNAFSQAVVDYDTASIYEVVDQITAEQVSAWFNGKRISLDPYLSLMMDNTVCQMLAYEIDAISTFIMSDEGILYDQYGLTYFTSGTTSTDVTTIVVRGDRVIKIDDGPYVAVSCVGTAYECATYDSLSGSLLIYGTGHSYNIDNIVLKGYGISQLYDMYHDQQDVATPLAVLMSTRAEVATQLLLYQAVNGITNATDWLTDIGAFLKGVADDIHQSISKLLMSLGNIDAFTIAQREALLMGETYNMIPVSRVADLVDAASVAGATSINQALRLIGMMTDADGDSPLRVKGNEERALIHDLVLISRYKDVSLNMLSQAPSPKASDPYLSTYFDRLGTSIISAFGGGDNGVEPDISDCGIGMSVLYPPIISASVRNAAIYDEVFSISGNNTVVLPLERCTVALYRGASQGYFDVCIYANFSGGSDADAIAATNLAISEIQAMVNTVAEDLDVSLALGSVDVLALSDDSVDTVHIVSAVAAGASGALIGATLGPYGALAGMGVSLSAYLLGRVLQSDVTDANLRYNLQTMALDNPSVTIDGLTYYDKATISAVIGAIVLRCVHHGAFFPLGDGQFGYSCYALYAPGKPYARYVVRGPSTDYLPLVMTTATIATAWNMRALAKAYLNPSRQPGFLLGMIAGAFSNLAMSSFAKAQALVAKSRNKEAASTANVVGSYGTYTDDEGTVTLRDILNESEALAGYTQSMYNSILEAIARVPSGTALTY